MIQSRGGFGSPRRGGPAAGLTARWCPVAAALWMVLAGVLTVASPAHAGEHERQSAVAPSASAQADEGSQATLAPSLLALPVLLLFILGLSNLVPRLAAEPAGGRQRRSPPASAERQGSPVEESRSDRPGWQPSREWTPQTVRRILLAEDDAAAASALTSLLVEAGFEVVAAEDAEGVRLALEDGRVPELLILSDALPGPGVQELCRDVRTRLDVNELPILLVSTEDRWNQLVRGVSLGVNDYLLRPVGRAELLARVRTQMQIAELNRAYSRFVPKEFLRLLDRQSIVDVRLGDQIQREMTVFFCDIRSFTALSESMTPEQNFNFLNSYLQRVAPVIRDNRGLIDKYIGDGIMALYPECPEDALRTVVQMRATIRLYNKHRANCGYRPIEVGMGLHTGQLILGTIGYQDRMESTVISDAVNLAARLESLNKRFGTTAIVSDATLARVERRELYGARYLGRVRVQGKLQTVPVYDLYQGELEATMEGRSATKTTFEAAVRLMEAGRMDEAAQHFSEVLQMDPTDEVAHRLLMCCRPGAAPGPFGNNREALLGASIDLDL